MFDAQMVQFAVRWYPFGGGAAGEIFVEFGLSEDAFYDRLWALVVQSGPELPAATKTILDRSCMLWRSSKAATLSGG